jgi:hypothetical protein
VGSSKFKKALAEAKSTTTLTRAAIPQVDPGEPTSPPVAATEPPKSAAALPATAPSSGDSTPAVLVDPRALPVDTSVRIISVGFHLHPDRHKQVLYEAFMLGIKPWEVIESALAEYFERRYGGPPKANVE